MAGKLFFGTAGWSYSDWEGKVYPRPRPPRFNPLFFLAQLFEFVEVNMTFYSIPDTRIVEGWVQKTRMCPDFRFWIKAHRQFTHDRSFGPETVSRFKRPLLPLKESGQIGGILFQFPYSYKFSGASFSHIEALSGDFCDYPRAFEFRHRSWNHPDLIEYLQTSGGSWVNIDQPVISHSLPLTAISTSGDIGYLRLHGRNYSAWFSDQGRDERYNYSYSREELKGIGGIIQALRKKVRSLYVSGNNHYQGQAVKNLLGLKKFFSDS